MRFTDALAQLAARQPEHMPGPSLERIRLLAEYLDHPELTYPTIHVTGTNGKTTAARSAAALACAAGLRAGLFISPHLLSVTERFSACGEEMTVGEFAAEWQHLAPFLTHVDELGHGDVTFFEAVTALAFLWFADSPVALGVFEVGMGGTRGTRRTSWHGDVAVVTPIGMDHVAELGPTLADIAGEKAGILKAGKIGGVPRAGARGGARARPVARRGRRPAAARGRATGRSRSALLAVGGQSFRSAAPLGDVRGPVPAAVRRATRRRTPPPAIVAVEALIGKPLDDDRGARGRWRPSARPGGSRSSRASRRCSWTARTTPPARRPSRRRCRESFSWERLHLVARGQREQGRCRHGARRSPPLADVAYAARNESVAERRARGGGGGARAGGAGRRPGRSDRGRDRGRARRRRSRATRSWSRARCSRSPTPSGRSAAR